MALEEIKNRLKENGLIISRLPKETRKEFKELANAQFCNDYGMTLKFIIDEFKKSQIYDYLASRLFELEDRLNQLEGKPQTQEIRTLGGKKIKLKEAKNE